MDYGEALEFIHSRRHGGPDLGRMETVLARLGSPEREVPFVHVAGTNGKGSTCAYIDSILRAAGYRCGLFTSPYVVRFNERIRLGGEDIPDGDLAALTGEVRAALGEFEDRVAEFELVTLLGLTYFARKQCDIAVLEVGMGGPRDATNVIPGSEVSVFTAIGLDHTSYLGTTPEEIASVKAGIVRPGGRAAAYMDPGGSIAAVCRERGARLVMAPLEDVHITSIGIDGCRFDLGDMRDMRIPLAGSYQPYNAALAVTACRVLRERGWDIPDVAIRRGLETTRWGGRFELVRRSPTVLIDGGHNPQAVAATVRSLREHFPGRRFTFVFGVMADKDVGGIVDALEGVAERFVCVAPPVPRAMAPEDLAAYLRTRGLAAESAGSIAGGVRRAMELAGPDGVVCALGSLYILEEAKRAAVSLS